MTPDYDRIPEITKAGIDAFVEDGLPPGHFLAAVFCNNLFGALERADEDNLNALGDIVAYIYNEVPMICYGDKEKVNAWIDKKFQDREKVNEKNREGNSTE